jgi:hypothetical protein
MEVGSKSLRNALSLNLTILNYIRKISVLSAAICLFFCGCAGRDFQRLDYTKVGLGHTTRQDVLAMMGEPEKQGITTTNGVTLQTNTYAFADTRARSAIHGTAAKAMGLSYYEGRLVKYHYLSWFLDDRIPIDSRRVALIEKDKTSRAEVLRLLGPPSGEAVYPAAPKGKRTMSWQCFTDGANNVVVVELDENGVVRSVSYSESK